MKRRRNSRRETKRLARETRQSYVGMALGVVLFALIVVPVLLNIPTVSPVTMVQAQVVRGAKIDAAGVLPNSSSATNALAVLSNSITATASAGVVSNSNQMVGVPRPRLMAADSNSLPEIIQQDGKNYLNLSFAKLSAFPFTVTPEVSDAMTNAEESSRLTRAQVPDTVKTLTEKPAAVTGFMLPVRVVGGLASDFLLMRNQSACCYGVMPRVNEWVIVHTNNRKGVKPVMDVPVTALGTFHVGEMRDNGRLMGIYYLECEQLLPTK